MSGRDANLRKCIDKLDHRHVPHTMFGHKPDYKPVKWSEYFDNEEYVEIPTGKFHIYTRGTTGTVILCVHGGGYSALTWALLAKEVTENLECQVVGLDLRGHGDTETSDDTDLSLNTLVEDIAAVANFLCERSGQPIILIGHSLGGAVAVYASYLIENIKALCIIDVVEGTALESLSSMTTVLRSRPKGFTSIVNAINWCHRSGQTHNLVAAKVSMPGQIVNKETGKLAADEWETFDTLTTDSVQRKDEKLSFSIPEEEEEDNSNDSGLPPLPKNPKTESSANNASSSSRNQSKVFAKPGKEEEMYRWRIDLSKTEKYWSSWFKGLSEKFLEAPAPKLLLLANINGLDTSLTVGQMQGKFQLQVLPKVGHAIHEDQPCQVSELLCAFLVRQKVIEGKPGFLPRNMFSL